MLPELLYHLVIMSTAVFSSGISGFSLLLLFSKGYNFYSKVPPTLGINITLLNALKHVNSLASQFLSKYPPYQLAEVKEKIPQHCKHTTEKLQDK